LKVTRNFVRLQQCRVTKRSRRQLSWNIPLLRW